MNEIKTVASAINPKPEDIKNALTFFEIWGKAFKYLWQQVGGKDYDMAETYCLACADCVLILRGGVAKYMTLERRNEVLQNFADDFRKEAARRKMQLSENTKKRVAFIENFIEQSKPLITEGVQIDMFSE